MTAVLMGCWPRDGGNAKSRKGHGARVVRARGIFCVAVFLSRVGHGGEMWKCRLHGKNVLCTYLQCIVACLRRRLSGMDETRETRAGPALRR